MKIINANFHGNKIYNKLQQANLINFNLPLFIHAYLGNILYEVENLSFIYDLLAQMLSKLI